MLEANSKRPAREQLTARRLFELLRAEGYEGAYDTVQRHVREWRRQQSRLGPAVGAILPLPPKILPLPPKIRT
jgi:transposase